MVGRNDAALTSLLRAQITDPSNSRLGGVPAGEHFVPRLFTELDQPIRSVSVARPSLDDVFMSYTGTTIRDAESGETDARRKMARMMNR